MNKIHYHMFANKSICGMTMNGDKEVNRRLFVHADPYHRCVTCLIRLKQHGYDLQGLKVRYKKPFGETLS